MIDQGSNGVFHSIASNGSTNLDGSNLIFDSSSGDLFHIMASSGGVDLDGSNSI